MREVQEYLRRLLCSKNMIIKVMEADLFLVPEMDTQNGVIGFKCSANANAQGMEGRIDIKANFLMPEGKTFELTVQDLELHKMIDNLEFIKATDPYPMNETIDTIMFKKKTVK